MPEIKVCRGQTNLIFNRMVIIPRIKRFTKGTKFRIETKCEKCDLWYIFKLNSQYGTNNEDRVCPYCGYDHINELSLEDKITYLKQEKGN